MASWPAGLAKRGNNRLQLPPVQQKSKIPVRITQLRSNRDNSSSSVDEMKKTRHLPREGADKFPLSRIPVAACVKKNIKGSERLIKSTQPTGEQKVPREGSGKLFWIFLLRVELRRKDICLTWAMFVYNLTRFQYSEYLNQAILGWIVGTRESLNEWKKWREENLETFLRPHYLPLGLRGWNQACSQGLEITN